jgi:glycosyltransferase involved in cell wall biosynthesis
MKALEQAFQFIQLFSEGKIVVALQNLLTHPSICYDDLCTKEDVLWHILNYADACVFGTSQEVHSINRILQVLIQTDFLLKTDARMAGSIQTFISALSYEELYLRLLVQATIGNSQPSLIEIYDVSQFIHLLLNYKQATPKEQNRFLSLLPPFYRTAMQERIMLQQRMALLYKSKPLFAQLLESHDLLLHFPWYMFKYASSFTSFSPSSGVPLIFLEPLEGDYEELLAPYANQKAFFVFETMTAFLQMLQFEPVLNALSNPLHFIYILTLYPNEQLRAQQIAQLEIEAFDLLFLIKDSFLSKTYSDHLAALLKACCRQSEEEMQKETETANALYQLGKRWEADRRAHRYGKSRILPLIEQISLQDWFDPFKGKYVSQQLSLPLYQQMYRDYLQTLASQRKPKPMKQKERLRLVHIVPQVVDATHAPSHLLDLLLTHQNRERFELFLIVTERFSLHILDYPLNFYISASSSQRAPQLLKKFTELGVSIYIEQAGASLEQKAHHVVEILRQLNGDVAVFHGPDVIHTTSAQQTETPLRVLFEHGTIPLYSGFDIAILSTEEMLAKEKDQLRELGTESYALLFADNVREKWEKEPYSKEELGFPPDAFVMTTISNHLDTRLNRDMCQVIAEILKRCPHAYYAPIGKVSKPEKFYDLFRHYGVEGRVCFLGPKEAPSQYARSMELYLNEFPFGSCYGMLDAMAAGCPVVSMYDETGPQQARYAAAFFGLGRVIQTGKKEDYIDLACRLIQDSHLYQEWSEHAKRQYEKRIDVKGYVEAFETIIENKWKKEKIKEA